ncbi:Putative zinc finger motif, C2HC5-type/ASCH domain containing protein, putative [Leishmania donovani]|uniref:Zinc finger motif, C2HC5-type/ASCH domain containing protein, putative n=1 Tax=Leishmania donovani TaxID=5661 RepID=A0A3S5H626_LEIDO|nr:Putative zinc finger motif, C2HC5-type/ASCH domain containing protein, putative [Leishmania donovani]
MPPKRWARPSQKGASGENAYTTAALLQFICDEVRSNNCLGLSEEELTGMAAELVHVKTRAEVSEWAKTLMLSDAFAAEVTKRREQSGPAFEAESVLNAPSSSTASAGGGEGGTLNVTKRGAGGAKRGKRGANADQNPKTSASAEALKPGRFECGCFATVHNLRGSCANCGRVICEQEADDVCYACGLEPSRCIAYEISVQEGKLSEAAQQRNEEDYTSAVERRDRLLEYAQNRAKRTTVIDDQSATLFSPQSAWMSPEERRAAEKSAAETERQRNIELMHRQCGAYQVHMEFVSQNLALGARKENSGGAGGDGAVTEAGAEDEEPHDAGQRVVPTGAEPLPSLLQKIWYSPDGTRVESAPSGKKNKRGGGRCGNAVDLNLPAQEGSSMPMTSRPTQRRFEEVSRRVQQSYFEEDVEVFAEEKEEAEKTKSKLIVVSQALIEDDQDAAIEHGTEAAGGSTSPPLVDPSAVALPSRFAVTSIMRNTDDGICLSMHQPWASLLVAGIKRHEGRVWGTTYRGRLWIHAAASQPINVEEVEAQYSKFMPPGQVFPKHYPTKVLLGYVYVTDCLDREAYEIAFKPEERQEESPYSFICVEPKALLFPLPMCGNHKLFSLEHRVHVAARKQLGEID